MASETKESLEALKKWNEECAELRRVFFYEDVTKLNSAQLGRYLVVLANAKGPPSMIWEEGYVAYNEHLAIVVRQLLQVKLGEELHFRVVFWMKITASVAGASLVLGLFNAGCNAKKTTSQTQPASEIFAPNIGQTNNQH
jgi:hypothetical protein